MDLRTRRLGQLPRAGRKLIPKSVKHHDASNMQVPLVIDVTNSVLASIK